MDRKEKKREGDWTGKRRNTGGGGGGGQERGETQGWWGEGG